MLQKLSDLGLHGTKPSEVAKVLIIRELERLTKEGFLTIDPKSVESNSHKTTSDPSFLERPVR